MIDGRCSVLWWTVCLVVPAPLFGQDRDSNAVTEEGLQERFDRRIAATHWVPSTQSIAMQLLENYELVAAGEFFDFPAEAADDPAILEPRDIIVGFNLIAVYKGDAAPGFTIAVQVTSDMLSFPGEPAVSRYAKRQDVRQERVKQLEELDQQLALLAEDLENGRITPQAFRDLEARLLSRRDELIADSLATSTRIVAVVHAKTFYDLGGVIRPDIQYLVGLNRTLDTIHVYLLEEIPRNGQNIVWGETFDEVARVLNEQAR